MMSTTNVGPWQQGKGTRVYHNGGNNGLPSSPTNGEHNDATVGNDQGDATTAGNNGGNADTGTSSIVLMASNTLDHDDNTADNDADDSNAAGCSWEEDPGECCCQQPCCPGCDWAVECICLWVTWSSRLQGQ
jgi:hypothetical protein